MVPGRWRDIRQPTESELKATSVLALPLEEVSAKVRVGPPKDDEVDYTLPIWAGVLPLPVVAAAPDFRSALDPWPGTARISPDLFAQWQTRQINRARALN